MTAKAQRLDFLTQNPYASGMEGAYPDPLPAAEQLLEALLHLTGGLVGEGDGQDLPRLDAIFTDQPGDSMGQGPSLAGTGAGQQQQGAWAVLNCLLLHRIELGEQVNHVPSLPEISTSGPDCKRRPYPAGR